MATVGIVLELQRDCLNEHIAVSSILRKAKAIAVKLGLDELRDWLASELDGYSCSIKDLPTHRKGVGQPKFHNPYNGWCPIMTEDSWYGQTLRTVFLPQSVSELEDLSRGDGATLIMYYDPLIQETLQKQMPARMECALHFSKSQIHAALDYVRNKTLDWTLELERKGIVGQGFTFEDDQKRDAQMVTNHIYGGNIGVLGSVSGDAHNSHFFTGSSVDVSRVQSFLAQAVPASAGLDPETRDQVQPLLAELRDATKGEVEPHRVKSALQTLRNILEGASGNLVASAILGALTG